MAISNLFVSTSTSAVAQHDKPLSIQRALDTCEDILLIGTPYSKEWPIFKTRPSKVDHINTYWLRNADLHDRIRQALKHHRYDAVICCSEPLAPWMDLTEKESNDAVSLITAYGYALQMNKHYPHQNTARPGDASLEARC